MELRSKTESSASVKDSRDRQSRLRPFMASTAARGNLTQDLGQRREKPEISVAYLEDTERVFIRGRRLMESRVHRQRETTSRRLEWIITSSSSSSSSSTSLRRTSWRDSVRETLPQATDGCCCAVTTAYSISCSLQPTHPPLKRALLDCTTYVGRP